MKLLKGEEGKREREGTDREKENEKKKVHFQLGETLAGSSRKSTERKVKASALYAVPPVPAAKFIPASTFPCSFLIRDLTN